MTHDEHMIRRLVTYLQDTLGLKVSSPADLPPKKKTPVKGWTIHCEPGLTPEVWRK